VEVTEAVIGEKGVQGTVILTTIGKATIARVTVNSATIGTAFRLEGLNEDEDINTFGKTVQFDATGKTEANFELLNGAGTVEGTFTVDLAEGSFNEEVTEAVIGEKSIQGTVALTTIGKAAIARVTVNSATIGTAFRLEGLNEDEDIEAFGKTVQFDATGKTEANFELLNSTGIVVGTFTVDLAEGSFNVIVSIVK
jgi:DNA-binding MarR family transcriptional regulator